MLITPLEHPHANQLAQNTQKDPQTRNQLVYIYLSSLRFIFYAILRS